MSRQNLKITFAMYRPGFAGGTRVTSYYAGELRRRGHDVKIVCLAPQKNTLRARLERWVRASPALSIEETSPFLVESGVPLALHDGNGDPPAALFPDADVVIATFWRTAHWVHRLPASKGKKAYFVQHHELHSYHDPDVVAETYRLPLAKLTISSWLRDVMARQYGAYDVPVVHNSIDLEQFSAPRRQKNETPTVGLMYSTTPFKAVEHAIAALERVRERIPNLRVLAFGSSEPNERVPVPPWLEYHKKPAQSAIPQLYAACDVWVCSSTIEGFGLPPLEAMACRTPAVSTKVGAMPEIIEPGINGFLAQPGDVVALAEGIERVLALDPAEWLEMSDAAFARARSHTWSDAADEFEAWLFSLAEA